MNTQTEASISVFDVVKQVFSVVFIVAGIAAFYYFSDFRLLYRVLGLMSVLGIAVGMLATTAWGASIATFIADSKIEVRKIVWPTKDETTRTTLLVFVMVSVVSLVLWLLDTFLFWGVRILTGQA
ncbi:MAG: preprotein translocase subunit SecE [Pseudomonadota bacterium]|jgi:preprotein translocase subunit SecE